MSKSPKGRMPRWMMQLQIILFVLVMMGGTVLGALLFLRPTVSEREKRKLTEFPEFHIETALNGEYWSQITTWYADTFPLRDFWLDINNKVQSFYGIQSMKASSGGSQSGDDIPVIENSRSDSEASGKDNSGEDSKGSSGDNSENTSGHDSGDNSGESSGNHSSGSESHSSESSPSTSESSGNGDHSGQSSKTESSSSEESSHHEYNPIIPADPEGLAEDMEGKVMDGLLVIDNAAYTQYWFDLENANTYIGMMNRLAEELSGCTEVYNVLIPNSTQICLDKEMIRKLGCSDERAAINYYYGSMSDRVHVIDTFDTLYAHRDEYIYFRTDHHWSPLGAYYVYRNICAEKKIRPYELDEYETIDFGEFLGSYYFATNTAAMDQRRDSIWAYYPHSTNELTFWDSNGVETPWFVISNVTDWLEGTKYSCFIGGDNPYSVVHNPLLSDGSSCLVVKESYGNALVPFLVDHYENIYVIDYRYNDTNIPDFCKEYGVTDLYLVNSLSMAASTYVANRLDELTQ